jgi:hypothetical protein
VIVGEVFVIAELLAVEILGGLGMVDDAIEVIVDVDAEAEDSLLFVLFDVGRGLER